MDTYFNTPGSYKKSVARVTIEAMKSFVGPTEILEKIDSAWNGVAYSVEHERTVRFDIKQWWLHLSGIVFPDFEELGRHFVVSRYIFSPFLRRRVGIGTTRNEACYYTRENGVMVPAFPLRNSLEGHSKARNVIEAYLPFKNGIEMAVKEIAVSDVSTSEEREILLPTFRRKYGLTFMPRRIH